MVWCPGIPVGTLMRWRQEEQQLQAAATHSSPKVRKSSLSPSALENRKIGRYPAEEAAVYDAFVIRRSNGLPVGGLWFKAEMMLVLKQSKPADAENFNCSAGWLAGFLRRFHLSMRVATNSAKLTAGERVPACLKYFQYIQDLAALPLPGVPWHSLWILPIAPSN